MPNTYTQINIQAVFTVQNRACIINRRWKEDMYRYITGIVQNRGHKLLAIGGMPDHVHIFFGMKWAFRGQHCWTKEFRPLPIAPTAP